MLPAVSVRVSPRASAAGRQPNAAAGTRRCRAGAPPDVGPARSWTLRCPGRSPRDHPSGARHLSTPPRSHRLPSRCVPSWCQDPTAAVRAARPAAARHDRNPVLDALPPAPMPQHRPQREEPSTGQKSGRRRCGAGQSPEQAWKGRRRLPAHRGRPAICRTRPSRAGLTRTSPGNGFTVEMKPGLLNRYTPAPLWTCKRRPKTFS
jgi:hypothetical protein